MSTGLFLAYVSAPLPDELLYSYLGRVAELNSLGACKSRLRKFFGTNDRSAVIDLPMGLDTLQQQLGLNSPWKSTTEMIESATTYPYHRPFLTFPRRARVEKALACGEGKAVKTAMGRVANGFGANPPLRYCLECRSLDTVTFGCPYWHRAHQLPGVCFCYIHGAVLTRVALESAGQKFRFCLVPLIETDAVSSQEPDFHQAEFALLSKDVLNSRLGDFDNRDFCHAYKSEARKQGFASARGVDYGALAAAMRTYYSDFEGFPHRLRLLSSDRDPLCWLKTAIGRPDRASHPICHLLLINFLFKSISNFASQVLATIEVEMYQRRPNHIQCASSAATSPSLESYLRDTTLSCRQVARAVGLSVTTIVYKRQALGVPVATRPKRLDREHVAAIQSQIDNMQPHEVAAKAGVSLSTVYRLRLSHAAERKQAAERVHKAAVDTRRSRWAHALESSEGNLSAARATAPSDYAWLYRNDRDWLLTQPRVAQRPDLTWNRVNWAERDAKYCVAVLKNHRKFTSTSTYRRVSRAVLLHGLDDKQVSKNASKLPSLMRLLSWLVETTLQFHIRKISIAVDLLESQGLVASEWRVQKVSNIARWCPAHSSILETQLKK
jgi:hypothetical protein